ncbi:uncharacterized protein I303_100264 [Kwoniella dejecticola CBS 10117]|uniref:Uncharacterized protein n=1 Tax=Kwoniella dejecticola CBS 10117 TaxID=1296121 RepID=A0A1A6AEJ5_9TREE|nr:uncharacterized protein I303_00265 [Kwoniella dejecticola CBS 10117]OBR88448.1 hypothetical protein I303_00265 [Kwoniella dejecticola CBS 10117]
MSCYRPPLADNSTFDICCFNSLECAEAVCGSFELLTRPDIGINISVVSANNTNYCRGYADLMNESYHYIQNATCGNTGFECSVRKESLTRPSAASITTNLPGSLALGIWVLGLMGLCRFSKV